MKRYGKLKVNLEYAEGPSAGMSRVSNYFIVEETLGSYKTVGYCDADRSGDRMITVVGAGVDTEEGLDGIFAGSGTATYEWIEPMTEANGESATLDDIYPVGIEITMNSGTFNPNVEWGGTWTMTPSGSKRVWKRTA